MHTYTNIVELHVGIFMLTQDLMEVTSGYEAASEMSESRRQRQRQKANVVIKSPHLSNEAAISANYKQLRSRTMLHSSLVWVRCHTWS